MDITLLKGDGRTQLPALDRIAGQPGLLRSPVRVAVNIIEVCRRSATGPAAFPTHRTSGLRTGLPVIEGPGRDSAGWRTWR